MLLGWQIGMGILLAMEGPSQGVESSNPAPVRLEVALHSPRYPERRPRTLLAARAARDEQAAEATRRLVINGEDSPSDATKSRARYDPFDAYERELLSLIRVRWLQLTAQQRIPLKIGQAKVTFTLSPDGQVSDIEADAGKLGPDAGSGFQGIQGGEDRFPDRLHFGTVFPGGAAIVARERDTILPVIAGRETFDDDVCHRPKSR